MSSNAEKFTSLTLGGRKDGTPSVASRLTKKPDFGPEESTGTKSPQINSEEYTRLPGGTTPRCAAKTTEPYDLKNPVTGKDAAPLASSTQAYPPSDVKGLKLPPQKSRHVAGMENPLQQAHSAG